MELKQLLERESETVEWKENVADPKDVVRTLVAFANDFAGMGGGYLVCGIHEGRDDEGFPKVSCPGLTAERLRQVQGFVLNACEKHVDPPIVPKVEEFESESPGTRLLLFFVLATGKAHSFRDGDKQAYWIRIGSNTREARNGLLRELLVKSNDAEPWDHQPNQKAGPEALNRLLLSETLKEMGTLQFRDENQAMQAYIDENQRIADLVPPLMNGTVLAVDRHPRNFSLLLFSNHPTHFIPGAHAVFSVYEGSNRASQLREKQEITGSILIQARKLIDLLNTQSYMMVDKTNDNPNMFKYPQRALQEAVINALVHRDYTVVDPTRVTVFQDRIEIYSPGGLLRRVNKEKFLKGEASSAWRNQALVWFFVRLRLAQSEGQGIPTIFHAMKHEGCPEPRFELEDSESVLCILPAHPRHRAFSMLRDVRNRMIHGEFIEARDELETLLKDDPYDFRSVELYCEACRLTNQTERFTDFVMARSLEPEKFKFGTVQLIGKMLLESDSPQARETARLWLERGQNTALDAHEVKRLALNYRRGNQDQEAIDLLEKHLLAAGDMTIAAEFHDIIAKARMDLAKTCMSTAKKVANPGLKRESWERCRKHLEFAKDHIHEGLRVATNDKIIRYLEEDYEYLQKMVKKSQPPKRRKPKSRS